MKTNRITLIFSLFLISLNFMAQNVSINDTGLSPNPHAILDIDAGNNDKGVLIPRLRTPERLAIAGLTIAEQGLMVYDESLASFWFWNGTAWEKVGSTTNRLIDGDMDTEVSVEHVPDEDIIRFYVQGEQKMMLNKNANNESALQLMNVSGSVFVGEASGSSNNATGFNNTAIGAYALTSNTEGTANTALGSNALSFNATGSFNTAIGEQTLLQNTANANTAIGYRALTDNTTGFSNVAIGFNSLTNKVTGWGSVAVGSNSLMSNVDGLLNVAVGQDALKYNRYSNNVAVGSFAMENDTSGSGNTAVGHGAMEFSFGSHNAAFGDGALRYNESSYNCAFGPGVLGSNSSGHSNVAMGYATMLNNQSGQDNVAIGAFSFQFNEDGFENVVVGHGASRAESNAYCTFLGAQSGLSEFSYENSTALGYESDVTGDNQVRVGNSAVTSIGGQVGWTTLSDGRFKKDIASDVPGLDFILKLNPVTYHLDLTKLNHFLSRDSMPETLQRTLIKREEVLQTGFIAQEVEEAAAQLNYDFSGVDAPQNEKDTYGLRYAEFVTPLIKAVQEQQVMIEAQQKKIGALEMLLNSIQSGNGFD